MKTINMFLALTAFAISGMATSCGTSQPKGVDTANLDTSVSPKADFYD